MLNNNNDNYSKLLNLIIVYNENNSYDIIINSSYKELVLNFIKINGYCFRIC